MVTHTPGKKNNCSVWWLRNMGISRAIKQAEEMKIILLNNVIPFSCIDSILSDKGQAHGWKHCAQAYSILLYLGSVIWKLQHYELKLFKNIIFKEKCHKLMMKKVCGQWQISFHSMPLACVVICNSTLCTSKSHSSSAPYEYISIHTHW